MGRGLKNVSKRIEAEERFPIRYPDESADLTVAVSFAALCVGLLVKV